MTHKETPLAALKRKWALTTPFLLLAMSGCDLNLEEADLTPEEVQAAEPVKKDLRPETATPSSGIDHEDIPEKTAEESPEETIEETPDETGNETGNETSTGDETGDEWDDDDDATELEAIWEDDVQWCRVLHPTDDHKKMICSSVAADEYYEAMIAMYVEHDWGYQAQEICWSGAPAKAIINSLYGACGVEADIVQCGGNDEDAYNDALAAANDPDISHCNYD